MYQLSPLILHPHEGIPDPWRRISKKKQIVEMTEEPEEEDEEDARGRKETAECGDGKMGKEGVGTWGGGRGEKEREFWKRMHFAATEYKRVPFCPGGP
ncbi:hypothetical protein K0M31_001348 [Melipona bicolor]|uniref:Uncharacterized protein n=1 Tax=Melipona bicolor TaxID=60889 RepID=A0AA40GFF2_9HYME|nr:hypothetical protein K0M31_001348 [Melipona bicolor]